MAAARFLPILLLLLQGGAAHAQGKALLAEPRLPATPYAYAVKLPPHLAALEAPAPEAGPAGDAVATLGRVLFHDRTLSRNGLVSCASCHTQAFGFDDPTRLSIGFEGKVTRRAAMTVANARFVPAGRFFRDERAASLEEQVLDPFTDPIEMGLGPGELEQRIGARGFYPALFEQAFGDPRISRERVAAALAGFVRAVVAVRSRYDEGRRQVTDAMQPFANFTRAENRGKALFLTPRDQGGAGCAACHEGEAFMLASPRNNGLPQGKTADGGLGEITGRAEDFGKFRAGTLRNVAVTAPYMHDGRFETLEEVVDHYVSGVQDSPTLDPALRDTGGAPARLDLPPSDREALVAFLETLTDEQLLADDRFSDPFLPR